MNKLLPKRTSIEVKAEQIRLVFGQSTAVLLLGIFTAAIAAATLWHVADHTLLSLWLAIYVLFTVARIALSQRFSAHKRGDFTKLKRWGNTYAAFAFTSGLIWGSLCLFYDASWPAPYQVILFVVYTGATAATFNANTPYFISFPAFYLPPVSWLALTLVRQDGEGTHALAALIGIYIMVMYISALRYHNHLTSSLEIRFENERLAKELAVSNERLATLADTDELTRLYNRRAMIKCLSREWNRLHRSQAPLSLMYIDIDFFKQYNDTYGHESGDKCLVKVAEILRDHALRASDMATRFGGEEFAIILPETSNESAMKIAASIQANMEIVSISHASSTVSDCVTLSIGVATMIPDKLDDDAVLREEADKALYRAKHTGRNRVVSASTANKAHLQTLTSQ